MQRNIFIISSTINASLTSVPVQLRYQQTIQTINSIRLKDQSAIIILVDNSFYLDPSLQEILTSHVDHFYYVGDRSTCKEFSRYVMKGAAGKKGAGEIYEVLVALDCIRGNNYQPKRIFKICGRYTLSDDFDINLYDDTKFHSKMCFKNKNYSFETHKWYFHTRLWSACGSMVEETKKFLQNCLWTHLTEEMTIEESFYKNMNFETLVELETIHCQGVLALTNETVYD